MRYLKNYNEGFRINIMEDKYHDFIGKKSEIVKHIETKGEIVTFGMLKGLWKDAIEYKTKRDLVKGGYKAALRIIPFIGSFVFFPIWIIGTVFGVSRAFNKIMKPIMQEPHREYSGFLGKMIHGVMEISEGETHDILGEDWFFDAFMFEDDIVKMVRKEIILKFVDELSQNMAKESDDKEVPENYVENAFRNFLNREYRLTPPLPNK